MARWRLTAPHYLNVPGTEWEQRELNTTTGKQARKVYAVPLHLDPSNPSDQTPPGSGDIFVCHEGKGQGRDIVFIGPPTPDMEPLDDEARAITAEWAKKWNHPIESLGANAPDGGFGALLVDRFERQIEQLLKVGSAQPAQAVSAGMVSEERFKALEDQIAALMAQNAELQAQLKPTISRRA